MLIKMNIMLSFHSNNAEIKSIPTDYSALHIAGAESDIIFKSLLHAHGQDCDEFLNNFKFFANTRISFCTEKYKLLSFWCICIRFNVWKMDSNLLVDMRKDDAAIMANSQKFIKLKNRN